MELRCNESMAGMASTNMIVHTSEFSLFKISLTIKDRKTDSSQTRNDDYHVQVTDQRLLFP